MTPLASSNTKLRLVRRLARRRRDRYDEGRYLIEGVGLVADALVAGVDIEFVLVSGDVASSYDATSRCPTYAVDPSVFESLASTRSPQPVMAVARMPEPRGLDQLDSPSFVVALSDVTDPGNVGTLIRAAEAAGADALVVTAHTADVFSPKTVRASAGSIFRLPVVASSTTDAMVADLRSNGFTPVATVVHGGAPYDQVDLTTPVAIVLGNEAHGLEPSDDIAVTIPMAVGPESLNVAMAGTLLCFEVARQRRDE